MKSGDVVGTWKIGELAGRGQSGSVFEVTETVPPFRRGALKIHLGPRVKVTRAEFLREAAFVKAQKIRGYMPDFLDDGELDDGTPFFVTEFAEKPSRRLTRDEVVAIVDRIAEALERLDAAKFYHGDVKPNNIGMIGGKAVLLDFGSVCSHRDAASASIRLGTPHYTAPELQHGGAVSVLTDLFSLGRTLEELYGEDDRRVFDPVAHHAAAFDPKARPQTIAAFRKELANALPSYRRDAAVETRLEKVKTVAKRVGWTVLSLLFCLFAAALYNRSHKSFAISGETMALRHAEAESRIGRASYFNRDFTNAVIHLERAIQTTGFADPETYGMLADCYRRGRGTKKDPEKSRRYATFAAERGDERGKKVLKRLD